MKKTILLTLIFTSLLVGCNSTTKNNNTTKTDAIEKETETKGPKIYNQKFPNGSKVMKKDSDYIYTVYDFDLYEDKYRITNYSYGDNVWASSDEIVKSDYENQLEWCEANIGRENNILSNKDLWNKYYDKSIEDYVFIEGKVWQESSANLIGDIYSEVICIKNDTEEGTLYCELISLGEEELNYFREKLKSGESVKFYGTVATNEAWDRYSISLPGILTNKDLIIDYK